MKLIFEGLQETRYPNWANCHNYYQADRKGWPKIFILTEKQAKARALRTWKNACKWSTGSPEFVLLPGMQLYLINPKRPGMELVIMSDVFGVRAGEATTEIIKFTEEDFR
jgi:hypothetical protein